MDEAAQSQETVIISGKRTSATQETLYLLAVPGMHESIKKGMAEPLAESAKVQELLAVLVADTFQKPPSFEKFVG